ncbi:Uncharacterized protein ChrSV_5061 [Chromobacterium vaccinii]|nr:Uncharacterized protein ChrSW_5055 [Chromobacterium vaccinii]QND92516.1 Uncharacterized protein ChrSV_5061 [Chromobacterium vaccinii]
MFIAAGGNRPASIMTTLERVADGVLDVRHAERRATMRPPCQKPCWRALQAIPEAGSLLRFQGMDATREAIKRMLKTRRLCRDFVTKCTD